MVIAYAYLINLISKGVLLLISGFLLGKGQTFCRLLHSFIKYFSLFAVLYLILHYPGFPIGTVVGSLSIVSRALSLGARNLAADILAGPSSEFQRLPWGRFTKPWCSRRPFCRSISAFSCLMSSSADDSS